MESQAAEAYEGNGEAGEAQETDETTAVQYEKTYEKPERWHALLSDGEIVSGSTKNKLKRKLADNSHAGVAAIVRGRIIPLETRITF